MTVGVGSPRDSNTFEAHGFRSSARRAAGGEDPLAHRRLPVRVLDRRIDLGDDHVDHPVQEFVFVGHVLVQRHRDDAELLREPAHAERLDAALVGHRAP